MELLVQLKLFIIPPLSNCLKETKPELEGLKRAGSELGAVNVMTGIYTGRSPKDKFIVMDENSKIPFWTSEEFENDNRPATRRLGKR